MSAREVSRSTSRSNLPPHRQPPHRQPPHPQPPHRQPPHRPRPHRLKPRLHPTRGAAQLRQTGRHRAQAPGGMPGILPPHPQRPPNSPGPRGVGSGCVSVRARRSRGGSPANNLRPRWWSIPMCGCCNWDASSPASHSAEASVCTSPPTERPGSAALRAVCGLCAKARAAGSQPPGHWAGSGLMRRRR